MTKMILILGVLVAGLVATGTASAEPGGATVTNESGCVTSPLTISCWDVKTVTQRTTTPSGNVSYVMNGTIESTVSIPLIGCTYTRTQPIHENELVKGDEAHLFHRRLIETFTFGCGSGPTRTCTTGMDVHWVDDRFQFVRPEFVCTVA